MLYRSQCILMISVIIATILSFDTIDKGYCQIRYFKFQRPNVRYFSNRLFENISLIARRLKRSDPIYYVNLTFYLKESLTNHHTHHFYFYQLLSNVYKRSFVDLAYAGCEVFRQNNMFGSFLMPAYYRVPLAERSYPTLGCPLRPGYYRFENLSIMADNVPQNFPFDYGRLYYNLTKGNETLAMASLDFELK